MQASSVVGCDSALYARLCTSTNWARAARSGASLPACTLYSVPSKPRTGGWAGDEWYAERDNCLVGVIPACEQDDELLLLEVAGLGCSLHVHESTQNVSLKLPVYTVQSVHWKQHLRNNEKMK